MVSFNVASAGKCYGREKEISTLIGAHRRSRTLSDEFSRVVLVSGGSGTGKTSLVQTLRDPVLQDGGYFVAGKFDQLRRSEPYSAFVAAFSEFCDMVIAAGDEKVEVMKEAICSAVGSEGRVLTDAIPDVERIIGKQVAARRESAIDMQANRFKFVFREFTRAISTPDHPLVLFLDDLQWADTSSLGLLATLAVEVKNAAVLFVLEFRNDEVSVDHPLATKLLELETAKVPLIKIELSNLTSDAVNEMISDSLQLSQESTSPLTTIIYEKAHGNVFFVIQYLHSLVNEGLVHFDVDERQWQWDIERIQSTTVSDNTVDLMAGRIQRLPERSHYALKIAACIGADIDERIVEIVLSDGPPGGEDCLDARQSLGRAVDEGLIVLLPDFGIYRFTHDQIQQAAYSLIPESERGHFHLSIGRKVWKGSTAEELEDRLFIVANQFIRGANLVVDHEQRMELAKLYLTSGEKAMLLSAFAPAARYLRAGIDLLDARDWNDSYDLCYSLFNTGAEAEYCNGNFDSVDNYLKQVFLHARTFRDKLPAFTIRIYALGARSKLQEAIDTGFDVLRQLGERFPSRALKVNTIIDLYRTKRIIGRKSKAALLRLPTMENADKIAALQVMNALAFYLYLVKTDLIPLITFRAVQLSVRYGVHAASSTDFAAYGMVLCNVLGRIDEGYEFGNLALSLLEKFAKREWVARVYFFVYGNLHPWKRSMKDGLEQLRYAHRVGLETGDIEYSILNATFFLVNSFYCGRPLSEVERDIRVLCEQMGYYNQGLLMVNIRPLWQEVLNLMARSDDPLILTGEAMDQELFISDASSPPIFVLWIFLARTRLACLLGNYEMAAEMTARARRLKIYHFASFEAFIDSYYHGLASLALAQKFGRRKFVVTARKCLKKLRIWAEHSPENCLHMVYVLEAEFAVLNGKHDEAVKKYNEAVQHAGKGGFTQNRALASERAAMYHLERGDSASASRHMKQAHKLYARWGAVVKVDQIERKYSALL